MTNVDKAVGERVLQSPIIFSESLDKAGKAFKISNIRKSVMQAQSNMIDDDEIIDFSKSDQVETHFQKVAGKVEVSERLLQVQAKVKRNFLSFLDKGIPKINAEKEYTSVRIGVPEDNYNHHTDTDRLIPDSPWNSKLPEDIFSSFESYPQIELQFPPSCQISKHQIQELERMDPWKGALAPKKF